MSEYTVESAFAPVTCRFCAKQHVIKLHEPITDTLDRLGAAVEFAIEGELEALGWNSGVCPICAINHRRQLHEEAHADDERGQP